MCVTKTVVDVLEAIEVEKQYREPSSRLQCRSDLVIELFVEAGPIGQPGEAVVVGEKEDVAFRFLARP